ncbi:hypothetical protein [Mycoplasma suis]|uniref:Uncharacterized protein n=1 Tax=Mycoplasma suis (strain Illinois) TaxID=768700 RepID=F0QRV5_MYCSL|nr:hypothetical protein [Mycoplasma suis]ADX98225.1 hypothetical protein MSU_0694 [Mycoplasma suis str. Illinois]
MLDSESKFEKVQGIWFDDIDWGVNVSYRSVQGSEKADNGCVYLLSGGYARGCKKVVENGRQGGEQGTAFQRRLGKERNKLKKTGWGLMVGQVGFVMGLIELVKGGNGDRRDFKEQWKDWFEEVRSNEKNCLDVIEEKERGEEVKESYKKKKCKWKLKEEKKGQVLSTFKKVFADEQGWAKKSFKVSDLKKLCEDGGSSGWNTDNFGNYGNVMGKVKRKFEEGVCRRNGASWRSGNDNDYVKNWEVTGDLKVIEGEVFEFGKGSGGEILAFEKEGTGEEIFGRDREKGQVSAGDWLKIARWEGLLGEQSCHSVEQWRTKESGIGAEDNQCAKDNNQGDGEQGGKWLNNQNWESIKRKFGFNKKSENNKCQWLMRKKDREDPRDRKKFKDDFFISSHL